MTDINIRIPNLPIGKIVDENGLPTAEEQMFRQNLITALQLLFGNQGVVVTSQDQANITAIQNNVAQKLSGTSYLSYYTCQFGTMIYKPSTATYPAVPNDYLAVAMDDGTSNHAPLFKRILEFDDATLYGSAGAIAGYGLITFNGAKYKIALYTP